MAAPDVRGLGPLGRHGHELDPLTLLEGPEASLEAPAGRPVPPPSAALSPTAYDPSSARSHCDAAGFIGGAAPRPAAVKRHAPAIQRAAATPRIPAPKQPASVSPA